MTINQPQSIVFRKFSQPQLIIVVLISIAVFILFLFYNIKTTAINKQRLKEVKSIYFPILEKINQNSVLLDNIQNLLLQSVMTGETDLLLKSNNGFDRMKRLFQETKKISSQYELAILHLQNEAHAYAQIANNTSRFLIKHPEQAETIAPQILRMNRLFQQLKQNLDDFHKKIYKNFINNLNQSKNDADLILYFSITLALFYLVFIGILVYFMNKNSKMTYLIEQQNSNLETRVKQRTQDLEQAHEELLQAHDELIRAEKMAALGQLVSGVAHEVNTPLGISITAASHLEQEVKSFSQAFTQGGITKSHLRGLMTELEEGMALLQNNLQRAAQLIKNFKKVAVDQSVEETREIVLDEYLDEILTSLAPKWKHLTLDVQTRFDKDIKIITYPGVLAQIVTNLISNAIMHGFNNGQYQQESQNNVIRLELTRSEYYVKLVVHDNGKGIPDALVNKIFEPFFTTARDKGGSGLGMHIVFNLISQKLQGTIVCESKEGVFTRFIITIPDKIKRTNHNNQNPE